jgi:hypothetical protein
MVFSPKTGWTQRFLGFWLSSLIRPIVAQIHWKAGRIKDVIFSTYILANGLLFHWTGRQIRFPLNRRRCESFQTVLGMRRALRMRGLDVVSAVSEPSCMMMTFVKRP